jgi:DNA-binding transcriptional regulator YiaG
MNDKTFAEQLRTLRTTLGWSRDKMYDRMSVPKRTIEDWEASRRTPPEYVQNLVLDRLQLEIDTKRKLPE